MVLLFILIFIIDTQQFLNLIDMSEPQSIKTESLDEGQYQILTDNYVHENLFTIKFLQKTQKGTIKLKNQIFKNNEKYKSSGQIKLWFPFWDNRSLFFRSKNKEIKLHYDHGIVNINNRKFNFYGSFQVQKNMQNPVVKAGCTFLSEQMNISNRVKLTPEGNNEVKIETTHKGQIEKGKWKCDGYKKIDWKTFALSKNAFQVRFKQNDENQFYLRGENDNSRNLKKFNFVNIDNYLTNFFFNFTRKINNDTRGALEAQFSKNGVVGGAVAFEKVLPQKNATLKVRAQSTKAVAFVYEGLIKNYGKFKFGMEASDIGNSNKLKYGAQIDINF